MAPRRAVSGSTAVRLPRRHVHPHGGSELPHVHDRAGGSGGVRRRRGRGEHPDERVRRPGAPRGARPAGRPAAPSSAPATSAPPAPASASPSPAPTRVRPSPVRDAAARRRRHRPLPARPPRCRRHPRGFRTRMRWPPGGHGGCGYTAAVSGPIVAAVSGPIVAAASVSLAGAPGSAALTPEPPAASGPSGRRRSRAVPRPGHGAAGGAPAVPEDEQELQQPATGPRSGRSALRPPGRVRSARAAR